MAARTMLGSFEFDSAPDVDIPLRVDMRAVFMGSASKRLLGWCVVMVVALAAGAFAAEEPPAGGYNAKGKRDPFVPLIRDGRIVDVTSSTPTYSDANNPVLKGILYDPGGNSLALINDLEVKAGDAVGEFRVTEIRPDVVVLRRPNGTLVPLSISFDDEKKVSPDSKRR